MQNIHDFFNPSNRLSDSNLSLSAKGLLMMMVTIEGLPNEVKVDDIQKFCNNEISEIQDAIEELRNSGFLYFKEENMQKDLKNETSEIVFSSEERSYRRGYAQGFYAAKNSGATYEEVNEWRNSDENVCPPGSCWAGKHL